MTTAVLPEEPAAPRAPALDVPFRTMRAGEDAIRRHDIAFSATGSEYFRIWIVNLLLTLVTLGIYYPWAKVRRLRYFYNNTTVAGHALDFHGNPRRMLRGFIVAALFLVAYSQGSQFSPWAALVGALALVAVWPALFRASLQFRLSHTSWRGLRFAFRGGSAGAYRALAIPMALVLLPAAWLGLVAEDEAAGMVAAGVMGGAFLIVMLGAPYFLWRLKRYQHENYALGPLRTELRLRLWPVYVLFLKVLLILLVLPLVAIAVTWMMSGTPPGEGRSSVLLALFASMALIGLLTLPLYIFIGAYLRVHLQNLFWTKTGNRVLRFRSTLSLRAYTLLQFRNWLLIVLTLGLYWPFAAVANARMRLQAVSLHTVVDIDRVSALAAQGGDAAGDAAGDLFGFDLGY